MDNRRAMWTRLLWSALALVSVGWMVAYFLYIERAIGWHNAAAALLPHEMAMLVLGLVVPPLLLVTLIAAFRGQMQVHLREEAVERLPLALQEAREHAEATTNRLIADVEKRSDALGDRLAAAGNRIDAISERLSVQADELQRFSELVDKLTHERMAFDATVAPRMADLGDLEHKTVELRNLAEQAVNISRMTIAGLSEASAGMSGDLAGGSRKLITKAGSGVLGSVTV